MADKRSSESSFNKKEEIKRVEIDDLVKALHTMYEFANMPSMMIRKRRSNGECVPKRPRGTTRTKSTILSNKFKKSADEQFFKGEYRLATTTYTKCLKYAEPNSAEVGHAYANRSAALFKLGKYEECRLDIARALNCNYPEDKKEKLVERDERCLSFLVERNPANDEEHTPADQEEGDGQNKPVEFIRSEKEEIDLVWRKLRKDIDKNSLLRGTSNKIRLECNETWGRHLIAAEDIETGEILSCEKYFALKLLSNGIVERNPVCCSFCLSNVWAPVPCDACTLEMYCSTYCNVRAYDLYHRIECRIFRYNELPDVIEDYELMALRMLLIGTDQGAGLKTLMKNLPMKDIFAEKVDPTPDKPFASDYLAALRLCRTFPKQLMDFTSLPGEVVKMIIALKNVGYFGNYPKRRKNARRQKRLTDEELFAALLLVNHMVSLRSHRFPVEHIVEGGGYRSKAIGMGVAILHNMINHSCNPNSFYLTRHNENVLVALRPISKGEQIFIAYCDSYYGSPFNLRLQELTDPCLNYRFTCQCEACINSWPLYKVLQERGDRFSDAEETNSASLKEKLQKFNMITSPVLENGGVSNMSRTEILDLISRVCNWLHANLDKPSAVIIDASFINMACVMYVYQSVRRVNMIDATLVKYVNERLPAIVDAVHRIQQPAPLKVHKTLKKLRTRTSREFNFVGVRVSSHQFSSAGKIFST